MLLVTPNDNEYYFFSIAILAFYEFKKDFDILFIDALTSEQDFSLKQLLIHIKFVIYIYMTDIRPIWPTLRFYEI